MTELRAIALLTGTLLRRMVREGIIIRSLGFPIGLSAAAMILTIVVVLLIRPSPLVAVDPTLDDPTLIAEIESRDWTVKRIEEPWREVEEGRAWAAIDADHLWVSTTKRETLELEGLLRQRRHSTWRPDPEWEKGYKADTSRSNRHLLQFFGALFTFYGVAFGAGAVARDRDEGTLEVELSLAVPRWIHGMVRWIAGTFLLAIFYIFSVLLFHAIIGLPDPGAVARHGVAASAAATAMGLIIVGRSGTDRSFAGILSAGITTITGLLSLGLASPQRAAAFPIASLASEGDGWSPLLLSLVCGVVATAVFTRRSATA